MKSSDTIAYPRSVSGFGFSRLMNLLIHSPTVKTTEAKVWSISNRAGFGMSSTAPLLHTSNVLEDSAYRTSSSHPHLPMAIMSFWLGVATVC